MTSVTSTIALCCTRLMLALAAAVIVEHTAAAGQSVYAGRPLEEVLRVLQSAGLRIVFSSEIVTHEMRVLVEPRARRPRDVLDEVLRPHHLKAENGPAATIKIVRTKPGALEARPAKARRADVNSGHPVDVATPGATYTERVTVRVPAANRREPAIASATVVGHSDLQSLSAAGTTNDPIRAVQAMPFAASLDDFRGELSLRGSPYRHVAITFDGVATPWLQHAVRGIGEAESLGMLDSLVVDDATLQSGVYPRRDGDRLGAQVDFKLREGSRTARQWHAAFGSTHATAAGEGPLGTDERGSWLVAFRQSYREWPNRFAGDLSMKAFGFSDAEAKLVYDLKPTQQVSLSSVFGRSVMDERGGGRPDAAVVAADHATMVNAAWRSTFAPNTVLTQRASVITHTFADTTETNRTTASGADSQLLYRATATRMILAGLFDGGVQVERLHTSRYTASAGEPADSAAAATSGTRSSWLRSAYVHARWTNLASRVTVAPGARVDDSTLLHRAAMSRWILSEWALRPGWTLNASAGVSHQFPDIEQTLALADPRRLRPERSGEWDIGLEHRLTTSLQWQATVFHRNERDTLRDTGMPMRFIGGVLTQGIAGRYDNALDGSARGVELLLKKTGSAGLSGWLAYAYGRTRSADAQSGETYWADFDQRHGLNASGIYRFSDRTIVAVNFRRGSNFPIAGYLEQRDGALFAGDRRNALRLPTYARLDLRASRAFEYATHRFTLFIDVVNVLNRTNVGGLANGSIDPITGRATGFTRTLFPRLPSAGLLIEF